MTKATYVVTALAGPRVAGVDVEPADTIELDPNEAAGELLAGAIVPFGEAPAEAWSTTTPALAAAQARARGLEPAEPESAPSDAPSKPV